MQAMTNISNDICKYILYSNGGFKSIYLWNLKKTKSLWLWKVATCRPTNCGFCGKRAANNRPMLWPRRVLKLFRMTSGKCSVGSLPRLCREETSESSDHSVYTVL